MNIKYFIIILLLLNAGVPAVGESLRISIDTSNPEHDISPHLVGLHQVYTFTPDEAFADGDLANWIRECGISTSRYPGGTVVKHWDWENPTGQPFINSLDPEFDPSENPPPSEWMSLDEFLEFAKSAGLAPQFGVNAATGSLYNLEAEGIAKAVRMVSYVKDRGFGGGLWYIGNEEAHYHGGTIGYAQVFRRYAEAMKAVDPNIRIFWNTNNPTRKNIHEFLQNDGGTADGLETHGKWPYGGKPDLPTATFEEWLDEVPLRDRKNGDKSAGGRKWRYAANDYRGWATEVGRNLLISNNEYGFGSEMTGFSRYTKGLLMTEMIMEHAIGNWYSTCFWDLTRGMDGGLLDKQADFRRNPVGIGMNMLADCQGGSFLHTISTSLRGVHGFAAKKNDLLILYILNKTPNDQSLTVSSVDNTYNNSFARQMLNSPDGYGILTNATISKEDGHYSINLPALSFTEVVFSPSTWNPRVLGMKLDVSESWVRFSTIPGLAFDILQSKDMINWSIWKDNINPENLWTEIQLPGISSASNFFRLQKHP